METNIPVFVTGGETGCGETVRGNILHIDYDEAAENKQYATEMIEHAINAKAPDVVIESLAEILSDEHDVPKDTYLNTDLYLEWPYRDKSEGPGYLEIAVIHSALGDKEKFLSDAAMSWDRVKAKRPASRRGKDALEKSKDPCEL